MDLDFEGTGILRNILLSHVKPLDRSLGYAAASFELDDSPLQDFLSGIGFAYALALCARVIRGVAQINPKCATLVTIHGISNKSKNN